MIKIKTERDGRVSQGDVLRNIDYIERIQEARGILEVSKIAFPYIIVLTQDCDLEQDNNLREIPKETQDKLLISVLVAPLYNAEHFFNGEHLSTSGITSRIFDKKDRFADYIKSNQSARFHFLEFPSDFSLVDSIIDFKHYFSVPTPYIREMKKANYVCTVSELYREDISHRFASFLSRIGLPDMPKAKK